MPNRLNRLANFFILSAAIAGASAHAEVCQRLQQTVRKGNAGQRLQRYLTVQWAYTMAEQPEVATENGYPGFNDSWSDLSTATIERHKHDHVCELRILRQIPRAQLHGEDLVTFDLAKRELEMDIEGDSFGSEYLQQDQLGGLHTNIADAMQEAPTASKKDYQDRLSRLVKVPQLEEQTEALLQEGLKRHITAVKMFLQKVPAQIDELLTANVEDSALYQPFRSMNASISEVDASELRFQAKKIIAGVVYPSLKRYRQFLTSTYIPGARDSIAWSTMPDGKRWYAYLVKFHTTTSMTPDELHQLGLREVDRITKEMEAIKSEVKFSGDLAAFNRFLLSDKRFFYTDKEQLLAGYRDIAKRIDPELPTLFMTLPRLTYGVHEMPAYKAADAPAAYYEPGSPESGRAGYFEANTTDLPGRPKWAMQALTLHEAVPGHHLQISLAQEMKDLPEFRKHSYYTAFGEGWGLYAESLGEELGLMKDPYSQYGQLSFEIWRAIRLVVDTGIHTKGWTRQQAIDYFTAHMPKPQKEIENEVDRYITWPGQALAYKVGELKFRQLRELAKAELGDRFNIRQFHDELLKHGSLPMDIVETTMRAWIASQKKLKKSL